MITASKIAFVITMLKKRKDEMVDFEEVVICSKSEGHPCGTPACVAGNYWLAKHWDGKTEYPVSGYLGFSCGADEMARDLGFPDESGLRDWLHFNPGIWGNRSGEYLFASVDAYGKDPYVTEECITMKDIIDHWERFLRRFTNALENGELSNDNCQTN